MKQVLRIAAGEWQYWLRSNLALGGALVFLLLVVVTSILSTLRIDAESHTRAHQQEQAEETFLAQPDRHPHRMVHYGHYVFRAPAPLAIFDPGLDSVTGQSIFLEGHRQNTTMFAESASSADLGGLSQLTPAFMYQLFAPLIIILLGYSAVVRERESAVLAPLLSLGINGTTLILGKALALLLFCLLLLIPLVISCAIAVISGEDATTVLLLFSVYLIYLMLWSMITLCVSAVLRKRSIALATLTGFWFVVALVLPSMAVNLASNARPLAGKIETDLTMLSDLRKLGDGHNAGDPAFQKLRSDLLKKHDVARVEDLPVNFRGIVALESEQKLTQVLNKYAASRMAGEMEQEAHLANYGWLSPTLATAFASRSIAGTDLEHYHRFQKEAEALRFSFVQALNRTHAEKLSYQDDINRSKDEASWLRARVDATNWQVIGDYQFRVSSLAERFASALSFIQIMLVWLVVMLGLLLWCGWRIKL